MDEVESKWRRKRSLMMVNFYIASFSFGLTLTAYHPTEYLYLKDLVRVDQPDFYYGLSRAFLYGSGIIATFVSGYYADRTKNIRSIFILTNIVCIFGNILYTVYYSVACIIIGQFMVGIASARTVAAFGELPRVFDPTQLIKQVTLLSISMTVGLTFGPCNAIIFQDVHIDIGFMKFTILNFVGIFMATLYFLELIFVLFTLENVSLLHNVKVENEKVLLINENEVDDVTDTEQVTESFSNRYKQTLLCLFKEKHIMFLYFFVTYAAYIRMTIVLLEPIKANDYYDWTENDLAIFSLVVQLGGVIPMALFLLIFGKYLSDYFVFIWSMIFLLLAVICLSILPFLQDNYDIGKGLLYTSGILRAMCATGLHIISRTMIAKAVPENIQTMADAIRNTGFEFGYGLAGIVLTLPSFYLTETLTGINIILCIALAWFIVEKKSFENLKMK